MNSIRWVLANPILFFLLMKGGEDMFRTMKYHYKCKNENEKKLLMFLFHISKNLYNAALYTLRQLYFNKENK